MIREDTRQTIKFIIWVIILAIIFYITSIFIFFKAGSSTRINDQQMINTSRKKTPITSINTYYHLDRGTNSYALQGTDKKSKSYYFIYLPNSKKAYLYPASKGVSEKEIRNYFNKNHSNQTINNVNLGWYKGSAVWEISYQNRNKNIGYILYNFKDGKEINEVDNL